MVCSWAVTKATARSPTVLNFASRSWVAGQCREQGFRRNTFLIQPSLAASIEISSKFPSIIDSEVQETLLCYSPVSMGVMEHYPRQLPHVGFPAEIRDWSRNLAWLTQKLSWAILVDEPNWNGHESVKRDSCSLFCSFDTCMELAGHVFPQKRRTLAMQHTFGVQGTHGCEMFLSS